MSEVLNITVNLDDTGMETVSARELHEQLNIKTKYEDWIMRAIDLGFAEGIDYHVLKIENVVNGRTYYKSEHSITFDMAKQICMIQRTPEGKRVRQYLIDLEKAWNTPTLIMARALKVADREITSLKGDIAEKDKRIEEMRPKEIFADAVSVSDSAILVRDLAKLIKQNDVDIGEKRLYSWMRDNGFIIKSNTMPTQKAMELGLFEVQTRTIDRGDGLPKVINTTKVTGKGQIYFLNKLLNQKKG